MALKFAAQTRYVDPQCGHVRFVGTPHLSYQLLVSHQTIGIARKNLRQTVLERRQMQPAAVAMPSQTSLQIHAHTAELQQRLRHLGTRMTAKNSAAPPRSDRASTQRIAT